MRDAIIDIEIANVMQRDTWDNRKADIILCGALLCEDNIIQSVIQVVRSPEMDKAVFADNIHTMLDALSQYPLWSLNAEFETEAIEAYTGRKYSVREIRHGLHGRLSGKEALYSYLVEKGIVKAISDPYAGDSALAPESYKKFVAHGEWRFMQQIMEHNINCLLKEFFILKNIKFIIKNAEVDQKGFIKLLR